MLIKAFYFFAANLSFSNLVTSAVISYDLSAYSILSLEVLLMIS
jgi:hypothetical protein